ncbi:hypothetical protein L226DRAFT_516813 [Lentinus tigrinus ALCF2SS1-7]|uniref:F-box domain-containing protein n=1 Tax=Lentinus tigrinus ALCF2SS1-6 TaxID=1328759 RepID=A0A5C2RRR2_9APHY|nr:hypothetical protein L227DRAFT_379340 [Lentinus tigrinus ALCF2SS1-6]RPD68699.1 hypothetical protein L226DRAFT_516813 [Lentinus tigrinus ALCF2SS1-7]
MLKSPAILALPAEIVEAILTWCAATDDPCAIASLAQTCRELRSIVYAAEDRHLWRLVFLAVFDDPREVDPTVNDSDWYRAFTERVWARRYIDGHTRPLQVTKKPRSLRSTLSNKSIQVPGTLDQLLDEHASVVHIENLRALTAINNVICTAALCTSFTPRLAVRTDSHDLPPLTELHAHTPPFPPHPPPENLSFNVEWLRHTLSDGLPYSITGLLSNNRQDLSWRHLPEAQEVGRLTSCLGFIPVPVIESQDAAQPSPTRRTTRQSKPHHSESTMLLDMSESAQRQRARDCARPLAFWMRYLSRRRNWGPYLPWPPKTPKPEIAAVVDEPSEDDDDEDMDSDGDYVPPAGGGDTSSSSATPEPQPGGSSVPHDTVPSPENLYPDWTWLAAARVVAECKLRAHVDAADIARLEAWDNLRAGAWIPPPDAGRDGSADILVEAGPSDDEGEEWKKHQRDWAGAEGTWRRLVCWLDYDDLIYHNSYGDFIDPRLDEAWIIVPLSMQITGYSAPSVAAYPDRPTIHIKGEMGGAGWVGSVDVNDEDVRHCHGTVSMLPDGNVRWSVTSTAPNSMHDEWASEAVQLGGVGSAMGALGMWTGAFHEDDDPLGVMWQWRVA